MPYPGLRAASCKYQELLQTLISCIPHRNFTYFHARGALPQFKTKKAARGAAGAEGFRLHIQGAQQKSSLLHLICEV